MTHNRPGPSLLLLAALAGGLLAEGTARASAEFHELYRGTRAQAMGNAFVAVADDDEAIFINPAGMAGNKKFTLNYAVADLEMSTDTVLTAVSSLSTLSNLSGNSINTIMGKDIYARAQIAPSFTMPNFGIAFLVDDQAALLAKNQALPQLTLGYQFTNGLQAAWGMSLKGKGGRGSANSDFRVGLGAKLMWRRGGYHLLPLTQLFNLNANTLGDVTGPFNMGYGADLGAQYIRQVNGRLTLQWGLAFTDMGDTYFGSADAQKSSLSSGVALIYRLPRASITLAYDYKHILDSVDYRKKQHLGVEFALPLLSLYGGLNEFGLTYGVGFDFWVFKIMAASYVEEQASELGLDPEHRYMLQISMRVGI